MSLWRRRKRGTKKQRGKAFRVQPRQTIYFKAKYQYLADIVDLSSPEGAKLAAVALLKEFNSAQSRQKMRRVKRATVLAANRAAVGAGNKKLSFAEQKEYYQIAIIYKRAHNKMKLPKKRK